MAMGEERITIIVDGCSIKVKKGSSLGSILRSAGIPHQKDCIVAIGTIGVADAKLATTFVMSTKKGDVNFSIKDRSLAAEINKCAVPNSLSIESTDANSIAIGPFHAERNGVFQMRECNEQDILLDEAGGERSNTVLRFCKKKHVAAYATVGPSPMGRVISGIEALRALTFKDTIELKVRAQTEVVERYRTTTDLSTTIGEDGAIILTKALIKMNCPTPEGADFFLNRFRAGIVTVSESTGSYVRLIGPDDLIIEERNPASRKRGAITLRNSGKGNGQIYVYRIAHAPEDSHTVIGEVEGGLALFDEAKNGDMIAIQVSPRSVNTIGLTQSEASRHLKEMGLSHERAGMMADDDVIVDQDPRFTIDAVRSGMVRTTGVEPEDLIEIALFDALAPRSVKYFRAMTGLIVGPVGTMQILMPYSSVGGAVLLEGNSGRVGNMMVDPENIPTDMVREGEIGITNSINSKMGMIGVRVQESGEYGPTSEVFDSTNIIGRMGEGSLEKLKKKKEGERVYLIEAGRLPFFHRPA